MRISVYVEIGAKRAFASAIDWPGWCRSGRGEPEALEALVAYGARYAAAIGDGHEFTPPADPAEVEVVERLPGDATTDFGAPGQPPSADERPLDDDELDRQRALLAAAWTQLEVARRAAAGRQLRKGPRGGGRELEQIMWHVLEAERSYLSQLGGRHRVDTQGDLDGEAARVRARVEEVLVARAQDLPVDDLSATRRLWTPRYFVRRAAWHVLDHAWEIEDRVIPDT